MKQIKVRCTLSFQLCSHGEVMGAVTKGEEFVAELNEESEEYFALDREGQEVCVGYLGVDGELVLDDFELVEEGADKHEPV